jgi:hypothetical protein
MRASAARLAHDDISGSLFGTAWEYIMSLSRFLALTAASAKSLGQQSLTSALYLRHDSHTITADGSARLSCKRMDYENTVRGGLLLLVAVLPCADAAAAAVTQRRRRACPPCIRIIVGTEFQ